MCYIQLQKKYLIAFLCLFFSSFIFSQEITIHVVNKEKQNLDNVNVQLLKNDKTINFKTTNENGVCSFVVSEKGIYTLKFTSMLYKTKFVEINTQEKTNFEVILESQITEIQEVKIKSRPKIAFMKEDTISYNIKAIKDGTERTVEDLVRKLPGLDINENGKVTNKGNIVGQVLIDGNEFFGKNHKMATQNITADMIEGIDLWQNYTTISGNQSTALNLKLKDEYKGKITGNAEANYGNKNSYLVHTNLFKFSKAGNLALIADANSIAKDPIGMMDFYEMNKQDDVDNSNGTKRMETPTFLNNDGKVKEKNNQFGALQYSKTSKNFSVTAFSIFNTAQLEKLSTVNRIAFEGQPATYNFYENRTEKNKGYFGTTQLKIKKTFADKSFLYYSFGYNPSEDNFNQNIIRNSTFYRIENKIKNNTYGNFLSWNKKFNTSKVIITFSQQKNANSSVLGINSTENLFQNSYNNLLQALDTNSEKYSFDFNLKNNFNFATVNFHSGYSYKNDNATLSEIFTLESETKNLKTYDFINEIFIQKYMGDFDISGAISSHFLNFNQAEKNYFEKNLQIRYKLQSKASMSFGLEYSNLYKSSDFIELLENKNYNRNFSYNQNFSLLPENLINTDIFKFNFFRFNLSKGNHFFAMLMYEKANSNFSKDVTNFGMFSQTLNLLGNLNDRWLLIISDDRKIGNYFSLKTKLTGLASRTNNFVNQQSNETDMKNLEIGQKISSKFEKLPVQFDLGYTFSKSFFNQSLFNTKSNQENIKLSIGLRANLRKEWIGNILGEYLIQKTQQTTLKNFLLGGQISYRKEKSSFEYNLLFNNILNLNRFEYINSSVGLLGTEESTVIALHGYITGGIKFYF